jgi:hypothetical protein
LNDAGRPVGESHPLAKLTEADIDLIFYLREQGLSYGQIARKFDAEVTVSKSHVRDIIKGRRRGQLPTRWKPCA